MPDNKLNFDVDFLSAINSTDKGSQISSPLASRKTEGSLESYEDYFGKGQIFQNEYLDTQRAINQSGFEQALNIGGKALTTFAHALTETGAVVTSLPYATQQKLAGESFSDALFRNSLIKGLK